VARWLLDLLLAVGPEKISGLGEVHVDMRALAVTLGISIVTGVGFGLVPALRAAATDTLETLKRGGTSSPEGSGKGRTLGGIVVFEVALSLILLVSAGLLMRAYWRLEQVDPGFDATSGLAIDISLPETLYPDDQGVEAYYRECLVRLNELPGVESAGAVDIMPLVGWNPGTRFATEERGEAVEHADIQPVTPAYFTAMGIHVVQGRVFADAELGRKRPVAIVNERLVRRLWPSGEAVGRRIRLDGDEPWRTIVGVVGDVRQFGVQEEPRPEIYIPEARRSMTIVVRTRQAPASLVAPALDRIRSVDPALPKPVARTLETVVADALAVKRLVAATFGVLATVAVLLAAIGLYGVIAFSASRRTHEIGIRMALGARPADVVRLVVARSLSVTGLGVALGVLGALAVTRLLRSLLYGLSPFDPIAYVAAAVLMLGTALLAAWLPARRSSRVDPMVALRHD
jgi:putative ABC transport system permease protein